jgi:isopentenyldiphosphate isomerase
MATKWVSLNWLEMEVKENPQHFTAWFRIIMNESLPALKRALNR